MSDPVIRVENLGKKYIIGHQQEGRYRYQSLRDVITNGAKSISSRVFNPTKRNLPNPSREEFWALKDICLEIQQGDRVGIIGRNGAGKSTLLKILSRITEPTTGRISIKGRVASLLEVGTGFHPELTGRENIYLNGAILGMSKTEIKRKFDEIVDFAEVEKFLDTPVKRYSSGMYVRLAFSVAAHLEPEILIIDEVLSVGDINFQKKCLGKMQDISKDEGRTVLFVSHNTEAIQRLCSKCLLLERGKLMASGNMDSVMARYLSANSYKASPGEWIDISDAKRMGDGTVSFVAVKYTSLNPATSFNAYSNGSLEFSLLIKSDTARSVGSLAVVIYDQYGIKLVNADTISLGQVVNLPKGRNVVRVKIQELYLNPGIYVLGFWMADPLGCNVFDFIESAFEIEVVSCEGQEFGMRSGADGFVTCRFELLPVEEEEMLNCYKLNQ